MVPRVSAASLALPGKPHALYRFYDRTDALLYVGITMDLPTRFTNHRRDKPWWLDVHHISVEHFPTRREALVAEVEAVKTEGPLWNVQHNALVCPPEQPDTVDAAWDSGRNDLAHTVIDAVKGVLGHNERFIDAAITVDRDLALVDEDARSYPGERDPVVILAQEVVTEIAGDLWRFRFVMERLLESLPVDLRKRCETEARADWEKSESPNPHRIDLLPDALRHLGYVLRDEGETR